MVNYNNEGFALKVFVGGALIGYITPDKGFFMGPPVTQGHIEISPADLRQVADKIEALQNGSHTASEPMAALAL
jgi:hypothetical protein